MSSENRTSNGEWYEWRTELLKSENIKHTSFTYSVDNFVHNYLTKLTDKRIMEGENHD